VEELLAVSAPTVSVIECFLFLVCCGDGGAVSSDGWFERRAVRATYGSGVSRTGGDGAG
jgi:hypothetical protein